MVTPRYCDEPPRLYEDAAGMFHVVLRSGGADIAHFVMDRLNFATGSTDAEKLLRGRAARGTVTPIRK